MLFGDEFPSGRRRPFPPPFLELSDRSRLPRRRAVESTRPGGVVRRELCSDPHHCIGIALQTNGRFSHRYSSCSNGYMGPLYPRRGAGGKAVKRKRAVASTANKPSKKASAKLEGGAHLLLRRLADAHVAVVRPDVLEPPAQVVKLGPLRTTNHPRVASAVAIKVVPEAGARPDDSALRQCSEHLKSSSMPPGGEEKRREKRRASRRGGEEKEEEEEEAEEEEEEAEVEAAGAEKRRRRGEEEEERRESSMSCDEWPPGTGRCSSSRTAPSVRSSAPPLRHRPPSTRWASLSFSVLQPGRRGESRCAN